MKPYYQDEYVTLYCGDCREIVPTLGKFDLLLTDPPYGIGDKMKGGTWGLKQQYADFRTWDIAPETETLNYMSSKARNSIIWGGNYFSLTPSRCWLSWSKINVVQTMASMELAWTNFDKPAKEWRGKVGTHDTGHPTQKPVALMTWCITRAGDDIQTILDPFAGSGTTGVAAKLLNRKCMLIEREEKYCEIAARRLSQGVLPLWEKEAK